MQIGTSSPRGKGMQRSTSTVRKSKIKVTGGQSQIWRPGGGIFLDPLSRDRGIQSATEILPLQRCGAAHSFNCLPPYSVHLANALVIFIVTTTSFDSEWLKK